MRVSFRLIASLATTLAVVVPGSASAADITVSAVGRIDMVVPGLDTCQGVATVRLKTTGTAFEFTGAALGGVGIPSGPESIGRAFCALQNFHWEQSSTEAPQKVCQSTPAGNQTLINKAAASKTASGSTHTITHTLTSCIGDVVTHENRLVVADQTVGYRFRLYVNGSKLHEATGTLTRVPLP